MRIIAAVSCLFIAGIADTSVAQESDMTLLQYLEGRSASYDTCPVCQDELPINGIVQIPLGEVVLLEKGYWVVSCFSAASEPLLERVTVHKGHQRLMKCYQANHPAGANRTLTKLEEVFIIDLPSR